MNLEHKKYGLIDVKAAGDKAGSFEGYGAIFGNIDSYGDEIKRGAFKGDMRRWQRDGYPKMLLQHGGAGLTAEDMLPVGKWTDMGEDTKGLKVRGELFALNTEKGQYIYDGLKSGELDGLSIGYQTVNSENEVRGGKQIRVLTELKVWEVSIVTFPANDRARVGAVKNWAAPQWREFEDALREADISRADSKAAVSVLKSLLTRDVSEPISTPCDEVVSEALADPMEAADAVIAKILKAGGLRF